MTTNMHITAAFATSDDHREHARITAAVMPAIEALEEKLAEVTGAAVRVSIAPRRKQTASVRASSSELGHG